MTAIYFALVMLSESCSVLGQLLFKYALGREHPRRIVIQVMAVGVAAKAVDFFLWEGLLGRFQLSYLFPFDGLQRVLLVVGASIFLKEKATLGLWLGVLLITAGVALVSAT